MGWTLKTLSVKSIYPSHPADDPRRPPAKYASLPIRVIPRGNNYIIYDGNHRLFRARTSGQTKIRAYVRDKE